MTLLAPFFTEMEHFIDSSRKAVAAGEELSLAGLDERIDALCERVLALSQEERLIYESRLQELLLGLNALGLDMKANMGLPNDIPQHRTASVAYKTADSRDNFGARAPEEE
jgi:hypothetical protein